MWFKQTFGRGVFHVFGKRAGGCGTINYQLARDGNLVHFFSGGSGLFLGRDFPFNTWSHVAISYDGGRKIRFYLNGQERARSDNFPITGQNTDNLRIGTSGDCRGPETFPGIIDEFRIYERSLSAEEVAILAGLQEAPQARYLWPRGDFSRLVKNQDGTFTRTMKEGTSLYGEMLLELVNAIAR